MEIEELGISEAELERWVEYLRQSKVTETQAKAIIYFHDRCKEYHSGLEHLRKELQDIVDCQNDIEFDFTFLPIIQEIDEILWKEIERDIEE